MHFTTAILGATALASTAFAFNYLDGYAFGDYKVENFYAAQSLAPRRDWAYVSFNITPPRNGLDFSKPVLCFGSHQSTNEEAPIGDFDQLPCAGNGHEFFSLNKNSTSGLWKLTFIDMAAGGEYTFSANAESNYSTHGMKGMETLQQLTVPGGAFWFENR